MKKRQHPVNYFLLILIVLSALQGFAQNCLPTYSCNLAANAVTSSWPCASGGNVTVNVTSGVAPYTYQWAPNVSSTNSASNLAPGTYSITVIDAGTGGIGPELVVNGDFSAGNTGFSSSYGNCQASQCLWPDKLYAVGSNPQMYHTQFWGADHTTGTGNFMIINGSSVPNVSIWCQTIQVTPNTDYVFSTWVSAMNTISAAQLQFEINGTALGNIFSAPPAINNWIRFCTMWNSGSNTTADICIINQSTVIYGNDFALDDISFKGVTPCSTNVVVNIVQQPGVLAATSVTNVSCNGMNNGSATVNVNAGTPPFNYAWNTSPVQATSTASNLGAGAYTVMVTDANGCTSTQTVTISQPPQMNTDASATPTSCGSNIGTATANASGGASPYTFMWMTTPLQATQSISGLGQGTYNVMIADANGCTQTQSVVVGMTGGGPVAEFDMSDDSLQLADPFVQFTDMSVNATTWEWDFGDGATSSLQHPSHTYAGVGKYCVTLVVRDGNGTCLDSTVQCLEIFAEFSFYIPNAFTPTGDKNNEMFFGKGRGIKEYNIWLFDRWGNLIWDCYHEGNSFDWDNAGQDGMPSACTWNGTVVNGGVDMNGKSGQQVQEDVYVWKVKLTDIFNKKHEYIGHVSVVR